MISLQNNVPSLENNFSDVDYLIQSFYNNLDGCLSSKGEYKRKIRPFLKWIDKKYAGNLRLVKRADVLEYKERLTAEGKSQGTICLAVTTVRKFFQWLEIEGIFPDISKGIKSPRKSKGFKRDCLTVEQIHECLNSFNKEKTIGLRDFCMFNLMVRTGLRVGEVSEATVRDIRQIDGQAVLYVKSKGLESKDDYVILVEECIKPIREYLARRQLLNKTNLDDPLFLNTAYGSIGLNIDTQTISRMVKETLKRIGVDDPRITAHSLRHTAISLSIKHGATLVQAQAMSRHANPATTMIYVHNTERATKGAEFFVTF